MIDWAFVLTPLAVLPLVLLFRFVGCGIDPIEGAPDDVRVPPRNPPNYRKDILDTPDVIGYWRLVDPKPGPAVDEKGLQSGEYVEVAKQIQEPLSDTGPGPGLVDPSPSPPTSLIDSDVQVTCRTFMGGCVRIKNRPELFPDEFTIEAWVWPRWTAGGFEHTLFSAGNPLSQTTPQGFALSASDANTWIVRFSPYTVTFADTPALVSLDARIHIALTVKRVPSFQHRDLHLFVNGKLAGKDTPLLYNVPAGWDLLIGAANQAASPGALQVYRPFIGRIQEVALYKRALSDDELEGHFNINLPLVKPKG